MRRLAALAVTTTLVLAVGCGKSYEKRLNITLDRLRYLQTLDLYLSPAVQGEFAQNQVFLRPPKPLPSEPSKTLVGLSAEPGLYDLASTFFGNVEAPAADQGKEAPAPSVLRLHVLARIKRKAARKKGEPAPEVTAQRGDFLADTRNLMADQLGGGEVVLNATPKADTQRKKQYKRLLFTNGIDNHSIRAYFYKEGPYDVALIWDLPPDLNKSAQVNTGIRYCLETFAVGEKAENAFKGAVGEDDAAPMLPPPGGAAGGGAPPGKAF